MAYGPLGVNNGLTGFMLATSSGVTAAVSQLAYGPAQLCLVSAGNFNPTPRFLKFYDIQNANSGAGQTAAYQMIIPGNAAGAGTNLHVSPGPPTIAGLQFLQGLAVSITLNSAMADASGISGSNECFAMIGYR